MELIKKAIEYNKKLIDDFDGDINKISDDLITIETKNNTIWNPLKDISLRNKVNLEEEFSKEQLNEFINKYKNKVQRK